MRAFESGTTFLEAAAALEGGIVLLDLRMPGLDGLQVQGELARRGHSFPVIMATGHGEMEAAVEAIKGGAIAFLEKPYKKEKLLQAIEKACAEPSPGCDDQASAAQLVAGLNDEELGVLDLLIRGLSTEEIARELQVRPAAVEIRRARLMEKLGATSLSDVVEIAMRAARKACRLQSGS